MDCERALVGTGNCFSARAKWRSSSSACGSVLKKGLTPPTLSEMPGFINCRVAIVESWGYAEIIIRYHNPNGSSRNEPVGRPEYRKEFKGPAERDSFHRRPGLASQRTTRVHRVPERTSFGAG